ncbi:MAG: hypothetical protein K2Y23_16900, partial [Cyanobacteria bacterium]|nr:hypothetical protein [Cyanobacteriota bacterium]
MKFYSAWLAEAPGAKAAALAILLVTPTLVAANERRSAAAAIDAVAIPATSPIVLDGKLNEEIWQQAPAVVDFLQRDPDEGRAPTHRTEARIAYDEGALYVAVRAFDSDADKIVGGIDPIPWTLSGRRIRCPEWDQARRE